jgi:hypothetical protein
MNELDKLLLELDSLVRYPVSDGTPAEILLLGLVDRLADCVKELEGQIGRVSVAVSRDHFRLYGDRGQL